MDANAEFEVTAVVTRFTGALLNIISSVIWFCLPGMMKRFAIVSKSCTPQECPVILEVISFERNMWSVKRTINICKTHWACHTSCETWVCLQLHLAQFFLIQQQGSGEKMNPQVINHIEPTALLSIFILLGRQDPDNCESRISSEGSSY